MWTVFLLEPHILPFPPTGPSVGQSSCLVAICAQPASVHNHGDSADIKEGSHLHEHVHHWSLMYNWKPTLTG